MSESEVLLCVAYWLFGFVITAAGVRKQSGGLSVFDIFCCAIVAAFWPVYAVIYLVISLLMKAPWLTEVRYWKKEPK